MLLMSRHLMDCGVEIPSHAVMRINLAWEPSLAVLRRHLDTIDREVFLDIPRGRTKPPCNEFPLSDIIAIAHEYPKIAYVGVSQVTDPEDILPFMVKFPSWVVVVPKIESVDGCNALREIVAVLRETKIIMLDHDDLFHDMGRPSKVGCKPERMYHDFIEPLLNTCRELGVTVLRTAGVVFAADRPKEERPGNPDSLAELCRFMAETLEESYCGDAGKHDPQAHIQLLARHLRIKAKSLQEGGLV